MSAKGPRNKRTAIEEIRKKIRLTISVVIFVVLTLFSLVTYKQLSQSIDILPLISVNTITAFAVFLSIVGLYLAVMSSRQILRIILDYGNRLEKMLHITSDMREEMHSDILLEKIMDHALSITGSDAGSILLLDSDKLIFKVVRGTKATDLVGTAIEKGKGIAGWVTQTGKAVRIADVSTDQRFSREVDAMTGYDTKSLLCVPLTTRSGVVGVIELLNKKGGYPYRERDEEISVYLAEQAALSIIRTQFYEDQKNYQIHLTEMLLEAIDFHMPEKKGHSRRVARYGNIIARGLKMPEEEMKKLYFASLLHDVGFLKIHSDDVFKKEEFTRHPVVGYEMIKPITFYDDIAPFILHHHERFDGYGYPSKLKGENIPVEARIIAIAEAFDAMISVNSYQVPVSFTEAVEELKRKSGSQFDPGLVDTFIANLDIKHTA